MFSKCDLNLIQEKLLDLIVILDQRIYEANTQEDLDLNWIKKLTREYERIVSLRCRVQDAIDLTKG